MALPSATLDILDGGLGLGPSPVTAIAIIGTSSSGTANDAPLITTDTTLIQSTFGAGQLVDAGCMLASAGVIVCLVKATTSTPGAAGSVTPARVGSSDGVLATTGNPNDAYEVIVEILSSSTDDVADGEGTFRYSLDGGDSYSTAIAINASYTVPGAGFALTFTNGPGPTDPTFEEGDSFTLSTTAPAYSTTDLSDAYAALVAHPQRWRFVWALGEGADGTASATMAATLKTAIEGSTVNHRYARSLIGAADDADADLVTAFASFVSSRVCVAAGFANTESAVKAGRYYKRSASWVTALRWATRPISEDLGRVKTGALPRLADRADGSSALYRDENNTPTLNDQRFTTLRTIDGRRGYYITEGKLMSDVGSDFELTQHGAIMDAACEVLYPAMALYVNDDLRVDASGNLDPRDANAIQQDLEGKLKDALLRTTPQHVSAVQVVVVRDNNPLTTKTLKVKYRIQPKAYAKAIEGEISFAATLEEAA